MSSNITKNSEPLPIRTKDAAPQRKQKQSKNAGATAPSVKPAQNKINVVENPAATSASGQISKIPGKEDGEKKKKKKKGNFPRGDKNKKPEGGKGGESTSTGKEVAVKRDSTPTWKLSPFLGGRFLGLDTAFSKDEKYLFVVQTMSLRLYSIKSSLLVRSINLPNSTTSHDSPERIVSYVVDPRSADRIYIATSYSKLYLYNYNTGVLVTKWNLQLGPIEHLAINADVALAKGETEVIFVATAGSSLFGDASVQRIVLAGNQVKAKKELFRAEGWTTINAIRVVDAGKAVCFIHGKNLVVINGKEFPDQTRVYPMSNYLTCMDVNVAERNGAGKKGKKLKGLGDIAVGDQEGAIFVLYDVVRARPTDDPVSTRMHWHRKAVGSLKWALDGTYIISGGLETVLVLWQLDTGKRQYLPHLGAPIKNIVVSPKGSRYAITLSDNSIMVLSTSEFKAQANIAGIQSLAYSRKAQESNVPCLLHPTISNHLLIATPSNQTDPNANSPYIQTFDTYSDRHVSRQALTRTNATLHNYGPNAAPISEPDITHLAATTDGQWLASVDEWSPSKHDPVSSKKREVFLKFWRWSEPRKEWELITRVDAPHPSPDEMGSESILDLATSPEGSAFATLGADGCVKIWKPKTRARPGVPAADSPVNWGCRKSVNFSKRLPVTAEVLPLALLDGESVQKPQGTWGNLAFSSDASLLAVSSPETAFGANDSLIHLLDPATGSIRQTLGGLHLGRTTGLAILDRYLVVAATQKVLVWNLVHGKVEWEYVMSEICSLDEPTLHLAADAKDLSFAIAFSSFTKSRTGGNVVVWGPVSDPHPALTQTLSKPVAALKSAGEGKGFFVLDTEARVQYVTPILASHTSVASIVASGQEIEAQEEEGQGLRGLYMVDTKGEVQPMDVDEGIEKVVRREALEGVFDEVEVYEQGSVEAAFERVLALFAKPALGDDDEEEVQLQIEQGNEDEDEDEDEEMEG